MATKKIVPRATNEGGIGTQLKVWGASHFMDLILGLSSSTAVKNISVAPVAQQANGSPLSIFGGDTQAGTNHAGGYLNLYPGKGTGTGGGVSSGVAIWSAYQTSSGSNPQSYTKNILFSSLGVTTSQRQFNPADNTDYYDVTVGANGSTTISTVDNGGTGANLMYNIQGTITHNSVDSEHSWTGNGSALMNVSSDGLVINNISLVTDLSSFLVETGGLIKKRALSTFTKESFLIALSDETSLLTTGTNKAKIRMPYAFIVTEVRASLSTVATGSSLVTVDINEGGSTILTTKLTIDASESTSTTAATAAVIGGGGPGLADDAEITFDIDGVGNTIAGKGLKVYIIGYKA